MHNKEVTDKRVLKFLNVFNNDNLFFLLNAVFKFIMVSLFIYFYLFWIKVWNLNAFKNDLMSVSITSGP